MADSFGSPNSEHGCAMRSSEPREERSMVRAEGVEPSSHAWEARIIADILRPQSEELFRQKKSIRRNHE